MDNKRGLPKGTGDWEEVLGPTSWGANDCGGVATLLVTITGVTRVVSGITGSLFMSRLALRLRIKIIAAAIPTTIITDCSAWLSCG